MSLSAEENFQKYTATASQTAYDFGIYYFDDTDIVVTIEDTLGVVTTPALGVGAGKFTIQATNGDRRQGATITLGTASTSGDLVTISRVVPTTQEYDLKAGAEINPTALNKALDRAVAQIQQLDNDGARHLTHPITDPTGLSYEAPTVLNRKSKALGYDANGNVTAIDLATSGTISVDTNAGLSLASNIISAKVDETTTTFTAGDITVKPLGIDTAQLAADAVETAKIADQNVTKAKLEAQTAQTVLGNTTLSASPVEVPIVGATGLLLDEDTLVSDSALKGATQQSVKAYVDSFDAGSTLTTTEVSQEFPSGLVIKSGQIANAIASGIDITVTFDSAFSTACVSANIICNGFTAAGNANHAITSLSTTNMIFKHGTSVTPSVIYWQAIGY